MYHSDKYPNPSTRFVGVSFRFLFVSILIAFVIGFFTNVFGVEFLVYQGPHWMDELDPLVLAERLKNPSFARKYESRYRKGDIVAAYPDGTCREPSAAGTKLCIVKFPGVPVEKAKYMLAPLMGDTRATSRTLMRMRAHGINLSGILRDSKTGDSKTLLTNEMFQVLKTTKTLSVEVIR